MKNPSNGNIKSILKPIKESNILTQELENISDIESITIEHPKTATNLSKQTIIAQKPNKIKIYTKVKATDCTLQLGIFKRHIVP